MSTNPWPAHCAEVLGRIQKKSAWSAGRAARVFAHIHSTSNVRCILHAPVLTRVDLGYYGDVAEILLIGPGNEEPRHKLIPDDARDMMFGRVTENELREIDCQHPNAGLWDWVTGKLAEPGPQPSDVADSPIPESEERELVSFLREAIEPAERERIRLERTQLYPQLRQLIVDRGVVLHRFDPTGTTVNRSIHAHGFGLNSDLDVLVTCQPPMLFGKPGDSRITGVVLDIVRSLFVEQHGVLPNFLHRGVGET